MIEFPSSSSVMVNVQQVCKRLEQAQDAVDALQQVVDAREVEDEDERMRVQEQQGTAGSVLDSGEVEGGGGQHPSLKPLCDATTSAGDADHSS